MSTRLGISGFVCPTQSLLLCDGGNTMEWPAGYASRLLVCTLHCSVDAMVLECRHNDAYSSRDSTCFSWARAPTTTIWAPTTTTWAPTLRHPLLGTRPLSVSFLFRNSGHITVKLARLLGTHSTQLGIVSAPTRTRNCTQLEIVVFRKCHRFD